MEILFPRNIPKPLNSLEIWTEGVFTGYLHLSIKNTQIKTDCPDPSLELMCDSL